jgi:hypothetical protein
VMRYFKVLQHLRMSGPGHPWEDDVRNIYLCTSELAIILVCPFLLTLWCGHQPIMINS